MDRVSIIKRIAVGVCLVSTSIGATASAIRNGSFDGLANWAEVPSAGSAVVGTTFGGYTATAFQAAQLTRVGGGIQQVVSGLQAGTAYSLDTLFGQSYGEELTPPQGPVVRILLEQGGLALVDVDFMLDPWRYGNGAGLASSYVIGFVSDGTPLTLSYTLRSVWSVSAPTAQFDVLPLVDEVTLAATVPEPSSLLLGLAALAALAGVGRRRWRGPADAGYAAAGLLTARAR